MKYGGIELGGTKIVYGIGGESELLERHSIPTTDPASTLTKIQEYFREKKIEKLGIATFGPVDLSTGTITTTPKPGWSGVNLKDWFKEWDVAIDTDVNGACLGEVAYGAGRGKQSAVYGTIGTGIGFGVYKDGKLLVAEGGHQLIQKHSSDNFDSVCPFHSNCMEGLASGPAVEKRWGKPGVEIEDKKAWELEVYYLAQGITNICMMYFPEVIILGGGVMHHEGLLEMVREEVEKNINGYIAVPEIVLPELGDNAGIIGAIELGRRYQHIVEM